MDVLDQFFVRTNFTLEFIGDTQVSNAVNISLIPVHLYYKVKGNESLNYYLNNILFKYFISDKIHHPCKNDTLFFIESGVNTKLRYLGDIKFSKDGGYTLFTEFLDESYVKEIDWSWDEVTSAIYSPIESDEVTRRKELDFYKKYGESVPYLTGDAFRSEKIILQEALVEIINKIHNKINIK